MENRYVEHDPEIYSKYLRISVVLAFIAIVVIAAVFQTSWDVVIWLMVIFWIFVKLYVIFLLGRYYPVLKHDRLVIRKPAFSILDKEFRYCDIDRVNAFFMTEKDADVLCLEVIRKDGSGFRGQLMTPVYMKDELCQDLSEHGVVVFNLSQHW